MRQILKPFRMKKLAGLLLVIAFGSSTLFANEGMWLPLLVKRLNYNDMQKAGCQLTAEEIYDINKASLKDAIIVLNGGSCTAELISAEGLLLTNHHCAYGVIQSHSVEAGTDYLTDGFWAMNKEEEVNAPGMTASRLVRIEDVTDKVVGELNDEMSEDERSKAIAKVADSLAKLATKEDSLLDARVKSFFAGNQFYLFVYETFKDVRLVAAPPEAIGKYGGDTDNWMWPRHTGDFSLLRIYAGENNRPADYSKDNKPYVPKHHLPISLTGISQNDFAMIMGYPGSTKRYLTSYGIRNDINSVHKARISVREEKLGIYDEAMSADKDVRLQYASKYARISNYYKNSIGMVRALKKLRVEELKKEEEDAFQKWIAESDDRKKKYGDALQMIEKSLESSADVQVARWFFLEALYFSETFSMGWRMHGMYDMLAKAKEEEVPQEKINQAAASVQKRADKFFRDYYQPLDRKAFAATLKIYAEQVKPEFHPSYIATINKKYKGDYNKYVDAIYAKSILPDEGKMKAFLEDPDVKTLEKDPLFQLIEESRSLYFNKIRPALSSKELNKGRRLFIAGLMEMQPERKFYPDANSTMRLTYGNVGDYEARDAVQYDYYTTLEGVMEKEDPSNREFIVPAKLKELYDNKDYGRYGTEGQLMVNFITNNDITGGNSGSPVINGRGELIGCAFDGNWEAMSGDVAFEHNLQRTIVVDVRYILFVIDKFAGAGHLVEEMDLVEFDKSAAVEKAPTAE